MRLERERSQPYAKLTGGRCCWTMAGSSPSERLNLKLAESKATRRAATAAPGMGTRPGNVYWMSTNDDVLSSRNATLTGEDAGSALNDLRSSCARRQIHQP